MKKRLFQVLVLMLAAVAGWGLYSVLVGPRLGPEESVAQWTNPGPDEEFSFKRLERRGRRASTTGIVRQSADPASPFLVEWMLGDATNRKQLVKAAENAVALPERISDSAPGWANFYNGLTDPFFMHDVVEVCGPRIKPKEDCYLGVRVVAGPDDSSEEPMSRVGYAGIAGTEPDSPRCRAYASCVAQAMLGRELPPLPSGYVDPEGTEVTWHTDPWDDDRIQKNRDRILDCIERSRHAVGLIESETFESEEERAYQLGSYQARLEWCEMLLADLNGS